MFTVECDRRRFVEMLAVREPLRPGIVTERSDFKNAFTSSEILLVWEQDPRRYFSLPSAAVVQPHAIRDFLAWTATYIRYVKPFTAHCRVIDPATAYVVSEAGRRPLLPSIAAAGVGLIIAEATAHVAGLSDARRLTYHTCASTLSFVIARAMRLYGGTIAPPDGDTFSTLASAWIQARELTGQQPTSFDFSRAFAPWSVLFSLESKTRSEQSARRTDEVDSPLLVNACSDLAEGGEIGTTTWHRLTDDLPDTSSIPGVLSGPREQRVIAVEAALSELTRSARVERTIREFLAGYALSRINPGSLDHFALLAPVHRQLPGSYLWYGLCAGLAPRSTVRDSSGGIGWLLSRELGRSPNWLSRPTCDVALNELSVLGLNQDLLTDFRTMGLGVISIELFPSLNATMRWPSITVTSKRHDESRDTSSHGGQQKLFQDKMVENNIDTDALRKELERSAKALQAIRSLLDNRGAAEKQPKRRKR